MAYKIKKYKKSKQTPINIPIKSPFEALVVLVIFAGICLFKYIKEHPVVGFIIVGCIITFIILAVYYRRMKWVNHLKYFYDKSRRLEELNTDGLLDLDLTKEIEDAIKSGKNILIGYGNNTFAELSDSYDYLWKSTGFAPLDFGIYTTDIKASSSNGISSNCKPIVYRINEERGGGYLFYLYPETVLAYVYGPEKTVFIGAFKPQAIRFFYDEIVKQYDVIVEEKNQNPISYYQSYNPHPDSTIVKNKWFKTNKDGVTRSFAGGLLPKNNPLEFHLKHGVLTVKIGNFSNRVVITNDRAVKEFVDISEDYSNGRMSRKQVNFSHNILSSLTMQRPGESDLDVINRVIDSLDETEERIEEKPKVRVNKTNDIFGRTDVSLERRKAAPAQTNGSIVEEKTRVVVSEDLIKKEPNVKIDIPQQRKPEIIEEKSSLTEESTRARNREAAKVVADALNKKYNGIYDFKVYQVRKAREGWGVQDAGVYTYTTDNHGNQYTIEFDLHTNLDIPKTDLKFSVWGKTKEMVADRYKVTVTKGKMHVDGDGYSCTINRQYEGINQASMIAQFEKDVFTLMKLIDFDSKS